MKPKKIIVILKKQNGKWKLPATDPFNLQLGLEYLSVCVKGHTNNRELPLALLSHTWSVSVSDIKDYVDVCLNGLIDPELKPAIMEEMRREMEGCTGDIIPVMFRSVPKPNQIESMFRNIDIAPDKSNKFAIDYTRERPTREDGTVVDFNQYLKIRGNQEIDQFNLVLKGLSTRDNKTQSIVIETPNNRHDYFHQYKPENIGAISCMLDGTNIKPILYKSFEFSIKYGNRLDIVVNLKDFKVIDSDKDITLNQLSEVYGFVVGLMELLCHATMLEVGDISLILSTYPSIINDLQLETKYDVMLDRNLTNVYEVNPNHHFIIKENNDE